MIVAISRKTTKKKSGSKGLKEGKFANMFNPLMPSAAYIRRSAKIFILF